MRRIKDERRFSDWFHPDTRAEKSSVAAAGQKELSLIDFYTVLAAEFSNSPA